MDSIVILTLYLIETPFSIFANRADPDQAALVRAAGSWSAMFAYGNIIRYIDPTFINSGPDNINKFLCSMYKRESLSI